MPKGKCFSMVNRGQRRKGDMYQTPYSMTRQLLQHEQFYKKIPVLEPASGEGAMVSVLKDHFNKVISFDIDKDSIDFLKYNKKTSYMITNPPFSKAYEFILHAKKLVKVKFALLLPLSYLHGQKRFKDIYSKDDGYGLKKVFVFTRYPLLEATVRADGKYKTGMQVYAWYLWENRYRGYPIFNWIDNDYYVLRK